MAHTAKEGSGGGYPHFSDPGGPTGSDVVYRGVDATSIATIVAEISTPVPAEVEGEFLPRGDGTLAFCNNVGLSATRACLMNVDAAQDRIDGGISPTEVVIDIRSNSACIHHCRLAFTKQCELATGQIKSSDGSASREISDEEILDIIGVDLRKSKRRTQREGRQVFRYLYQSAVGEDNGYTPTKINPDSPHAILAQKYIFGWLSERRPAGRARSKKFKNPDRPVEDQLALF